MDKTWYHLLGRGTSVDELTVVVDDALDLALALQVADGDTGERAVDLHTVNQRRLRDHLEGGHLLEDAVVGGAVEDNHVLGLLECNRNHNRKRKSNKSAILQRRAREKKKTPTE